MPDSTTKREFTRSDQAPKQRINASKGNVSTVVNKATGNKNAEAAKETKPMASTNQTPYNLPNDKMKTSQNTTQNWYDRFVATWVTQQWIAGSEFQNKRAHNMDNYHTNEQMTKTTKSDDAN